MALLTMGLNLGVFGFFADHTRKRMQTNVFTIFARCAVFLHVSCLHAQTAVHAGNKHLRNHGYFDYGGKPRIQPPCRDQDGAGSGISGLYLWMCHMLLK